MKTSVRILLIAAVLVLVLVGVGLVMIDSLARTATEKGVGYATGVPTTVGGMDVSLLGGSLQMQNMVIANPEGFTTSPFLVRTGHFGGGVEVGSLFGPTVRVRELVLDGFELNVEQKVRSSNISTVVANLQRLAGPDEKKEPSGKKVHLDKVSVRNVVARFYLPAELAREPIELKLPVIELTDIASDDAAGVAVGELTRRILTAVLAAVVKQGEGTLPPEALALLSGNVDSLVAAMGANAGRLVDQARNQAMTHVGEQANQAIQRQREAVQQGVRDRLKGFGGSLK